MTHKKLTVSLVVLVAVIMDTLKPPLLLVVCVTPPENVAVNASG
jgi:hypothetical protein